MSSFLHKSRQFICAKYAAPFLGSLSISANAAVITFGNSGQNPGTPFSENGFLVTASDDYTVIRAPMVSFASHYFAFNSPYTTTTVSSADNGPFDLTSLDIGGAFGNSVNITINALVFGGGSLSTSYNNVTTVQTVAPNWSNITSFTVSGDANIGIDNINVSPSAVPEPGSAATALVLASGMIGLVTRRRRRR